MVGVLSSSVLKGCRRTGNRRGASAAMRLPQIGAAFAGDAFGFGLPPGGDGAVMAGQQHVRHAAPLPFGGTGVVRIFQQTAARSFPRPRCRRRPSRRAAAARRVEQDQRGQFAAGQHVVADADLLHVARFDDALVDAFVAAAQQDHAGRGGEALGIAPASSGRPRGVRHTSGRSSATEATAASTMSGRSTMPAPPPNGVSSTVRCRSVREVADVDDVQRPDARSPARGRPATGRAGRGTSPGTASGRRRARSWPRLPLALRRDDFDGSRRHDHDAAGRRHRPVGTQARVNGRSSGRRLSCSISRLAPAP